MFPSQAKPSWSGYTTEDVEALATRLEAALDGRTPDVASAPFALVPSVRSVLLTVDSIRITELHLRASRLGRVVHRIATSKNHPDAAYATAIKNRWKKEIIEAWRKEKEKEKKKEKKGPKGQI